MEKTKSNSKLLKEHEKWFYGLVKTGGLGNFRLRPICMSYLCIISSDLLNPNTRQFKQGRQFSGLIFSQNQVLLAIIYIRARY
jgi:hypothetical protein